MKWLIAPVLSLLIIGLCRADESLFDAEPQHPWNRLHRRLHVRTTPDGAVYDQESLEPVFVRRSQYLTAGMSHQQAVAVLDEFLQRDAETLIDDPLKRAILQRDLWAVFITTAEATLDRQPQRRELQARLARVMRRVALGADQIEQLPDNLTAAVVSGAFAKDYRGDQPEQPFLPDDLTAAEGPWVLIGNRLRSDHLAAPVHVRATDGRAAFLLYLRLPAGRLATLEYLSRLEDLSSGEEIPQIPAGTQVALVRRMMLIDRDGKLRLSPLTESVQFRVYQELTAPEMFEFRLRRKQLFAGRTGGLHPTPADEVNYFDLGFLGFSSHLRRDPLEADFPPSDPPRTPVVMQSCRACHAGPGIFGFQSMFVDHFDRPPLGTSELTEQVAPILERTYQSYAWGLLQGLWHK